MEYSSGADIIEFIEYAFDSYKKIFVSDKNLVFSPLGFRLIHSVLYQCATGDTELAVVRNLFKITDMVDRKEILQSQLINLSRLSAQPTYFNVVTKFFTTTFQSPSKRFESTLKKFNIRSKPVKFHKRRDELAKYLDDWIVLKSNGKINKMFDIEQIFDVTTLLAVSSLYFNCPWYSPYTKDSIITKNFTNFNGELVAMQFITDEDTYRISHDDNFDVLEIPYTPETNLMLWIFLPTHTETSMFDLKDKLNLTHLQQINNSFQSYTARIQIPMIDVTNEIDGKHIIPELHNKSNMDVYEKTKIVEWTEIRQKINFSINTNGTQPVNSNLVKTRRVSGYHGMKHFKVNRPFIYLVVTSGKLEPIIMGHYVDAK